MKNDRHGLELWLLWSLAAGIVALIGALAGLSNVKQDVLLALIALFGPILNSVINSIRGVRQSQAMQEMASQLGQSTPPSSPNLPAPLDLSGAELPQTGEPQ